MKTKQTQARIQAPTIDWLTPEQAQVAWQIPAEMADGGKMMARLVETASDQLPLSAKVSSGAGP